VRAEVVRRGGLAGLAMRGTVETGQLEPQVRERVEAALRALPFGQPPAPATHPDSFSYEITVHDAAGARTATVDESQLPGELAAVVNATLSVG
jgi:Emfourin